MFSIEQKIERKKKIHERKNKKKETKEYDTIESVDKSKQKYFEELQKNILPKLKNELKKAKTPDEKQRLTTEIESIKSRKEETDYYLKVGNILFKYENLTEPKTKEEFDEKMKLTTEYFTTLHLPIPKYLQNSFYNDQSPYCPKCDAHNSFSFNKEYLVCTDCGFTNSTEVILDNKINIEIKDNYTQGSMKSPIVYERINYFEEWLRQIQAKENVSTLPQEVIDTVTLEIKKHKIKDMSKLKYDVVKKILKNTNLSKYYEHIPYIIYSINKIEPLNIPYHIENTLKAMFVAIQYPWEKHKPNERSNFFSYPYTLYKFCQMLGLNQYLSYFPLLKDRVKLYKNDIIWKKIVEEMASIEVQTEPALQGIKWRFINTV
ncbi:MAG TPA: hypothetical protein V6C58_26630 [Allocoleopsis sp.]